MKDYTARNGKTYPVSDGFDLTSTTDILNLEASLIVLDGEDYRAFLGEDCPLDKVACTRWDRLDCSCTVGLLWRTDKLPSEREHFVHRCIGVERRDGTPIEAIRWTFCDKHGATILGKLT